MMEESRSPCLSQVEIGDDFPRWWCWMILDVQIGDWWVRNIHDGGWSSMMSSNEVLHLWWWSEISILAEDGRWGWRSEDSRWRRFWWMLFFQDRRRKMMIIHVLLPPSSKIPPPVVINWETPWKVGADDDDQRLQSNLAEEWRWRWGSEISWSGEDFDECSSFKLKTEDDDHPSLTSSIVEDSSTDDNQLMMMF